MDSNKKHPSINFSQVGLSKLSKSFKLSKQNRDKIQYATMELAENEEGSLEDTISDA